MADDVTLDPGSGGAVIATDEVGGRHFQLLHPVFGDADSKTRVSAADPMPVSVGGTVAVTQSGVWSVASTISGTVPVSGPLTDTQLRASPVVVSGPLTDTQLRASPVDVAGTFWQATQPVSIAAAVGVTDNGGSLTIDGSVYAAILGTPNVNISEYGGSPVSMTNPFLVSPGLGAVFAVSASSLPLPTGAATEATLSAAAASLGVLDDWDESDRAKVNPIAGQAGVQGGAGAVTASTQRVSIATDANSVDTELPAAALLADGAALPTAPTVGAAMMTYNGSTLDLLRGTEEFTVLGSSARTATTASASFTNRNAQGVELKCQITTNASSVTLAIAVQTQDPISGLWANITGTVSSVIATTGVVTIHVVAPGVSAPSGLAAGNNVWSMRLPRTWRVNVTHSSGASITYGISGTYLP